MLKYLTGKSVEFFCICLAKDKVCKDFKKQSRYLHGEHLLVICRLLAMWTREDGEKEQKKPRRGLG